MPKRRIACTLYPRRRSNLRPTPETKDIPRVTITSRNRLYLIIVVPVFLLRTTVFPDQIPGTPEPSAGRDSTETADGTAAAGSSYELELSHDGVLTARDTATGLEKNLSLTLPAKTVHPFTPDLRDPVFCFGIDPNDPKRLGVGTPRGIFLTPDFGVTWTAVPIENEISPNIHFTSFAISPFSPDAFLAGTSFDGAYETTNGGKTWKCLTEKAGFLNKGSGFYEEISALAYDPDRPDHLYLAVGFEGGLYRYERRSATWTKIELPKDERGAVVRRLEFTVPGDGILMNPSRTMLVTTERSVLAYRPDEKTWDRKGDAVRNRENAEAAVTDTGVRVGKAARTRLAAGKTGIYLTSEQAKPGKLEAHLKFCAEHGLNSLVVDFKDDFGYLTYDTALELPAKAKAVNARFKADELIRKAHENGLYLIARIVVFKDRQLYRYDGNRYALWDRISNMAWGELRTVTDATTGETRQEQLEFWVDPYCEDVWAYNIAIAEELQRLGVDEIQFDYIRFPSDGDVSRIKSRFQRSGMTRTNALESFLSRAREAIAVPIGTDVYGFNAWFRMKYIGQDIGVFSKYVDVISPMYYPSHFPREFLGSMAYLPRAEYIYRTGTDRAVAITRGECVIRPYVQSFLIGGELKFEKPAYTEYLTKQLDGVIGSAGSGFTLWNASGRYYMVTPGLKNYTTAGNRNAEGNID